VKVIIFSSMYLLLQLLAVTCSNDNLAESEGLHSNLIPGYILWRSYFPGVFSRLFMLAVGSKGSHVVQDSIKCLILLFILQVLLVITADIMNTELLTSIIQKKEDNAALFLRTIGLAIPSESDNSAPKSRVVADNMQALASEAGLPFTAASADWRVDVLQKMEKFLFVLFESVWTTNTSNPSTKLRIINTVTEILSKCSKFMGPVVRKKLFMILVERLSDSDLRIRSVVKQSVSSLQSTTSFWTEMHQNLVETIIDDIQKIDGQVKRLSRNLEYENDAVFTLHINRVLGSCQLLDRFPCEITKNILKSLSVLSVPSSDHLSSFVLVNKNYTSGNSIFYEVVL
jgi:hypothetical protein